VHWQDREKVTREKHIPLGDLAKKIARITPGQKVSYITDILGSRENIERAVALARDSNRLFIEAAFLDKDREIAQKKYHLTAKEAGLIARKAQVRELIPFHFSPRYFGREKELVQEAMTAFGSNG
jgi:ribonuclease Z